jgi:RNA polymerase sigma-70 factor (ECF subfamily)
VDAEDRGASCLEDFVSDLFDQWRDPLLRYTLSFGLSVADSEEVVQETFLALFKHYRHGGSCQSLTGWMYRVVHNLALKRRQMLRKELDHLNEQQSVFESSIVHPAQTPEAQFSSAQQMEELAALIRALPDQDRRCLSLRSEGLRYRQIAEVLNISLGAVSISITRSLARITRAIKR